MLAQTSMIRLDLMAYATSDLMAYASSDGYFGASFFAPKPTAAILRVLKLN